MTRAFAKSFNILARVKQALGIGPKRKGSPKLVALPEVRKQVAGPKQYAVSCSVMGCTTTIPVTKLEAKLGIKGTCGRHGPFYAVSPKDPRDRQRKKQIKLIRRKLKALGPKKP